MLRVKDTANSVCPYLLSGFLAAGNAYPPNNEIACKGRQCPKLRLQFYAGGDDKAYCPFLQFTLEYNGNIFSDEVKAKIKPCQLDHGVRTCADCDDVFCYCGG